ncbi:MAG: hypothetical protein ABIJ39_01090 [Chloroflexota bacterium]
MKRIACLLAVLVIALTACGASSVPPVEQMVATSVAATLAAMPTAIPFVIPATQPPPTAAPPPTEAAPTATVMILLPTLTLVPAPTAGSGSGSGTGYGHAQTPSQFIYYYYGLVNSRCYELAWSFLSSGFRARNNPGGYEEFVTYYNALERVVVNGVTTTSITSTNATVTVNATFIYKSGVTGSASIRFNLYYDSARRVWIFY